MKKRVLATLLAGVMAFSLAACGNDNNNTNNAQTDVKEIAQEKEEENDEPELEPVQEFDGESYYADITLAKTLEPWKDNFNLSLTDVDADGMALHISYTQCGQNCSYDLWSDASGKTYGYTTFNMGSDEYVYFYSDDDEIDDTLVTVTEDADGVYSLSGYTFDTFLSEPENPTYTYMDSSYEEGEYHDRIKLEGTELFYDFDVEDYVDTPVTYTMVVERNTRKLIDLYHPLEEGAYTDVGIAEINGIDLPVAPSNEEATADETSEIVDVLISYMYTGEAGVGSDEYDESAEAVAELDSYNFIGNAYAYSDYFSVYYPEGYEFDQIYNNASIVLFNVDGTANISFYTEYNENGYTGIEEDYIQAYKDAAANVYGKITWSTKDGWNGTYQLGKGDYNGTDLTVVIYVDDSHLFYAESLTSDDNFANGAEALFDDTFMY